MINVFVSRRNIGKQLSWQPTPLKYGSLIKLSDPNAVESASRIFECESILLVHILRIRTKLKRIAELFSFCSVRYLTGKT